jgi:hypothetical protein
MRDDVPGQIESINEPPGSHVLPVKAPVERRAKRKAKSGRSVSVKARGKAKATRMKAKRKR